MNILIAEDDANIALALTILLRQAISSVVITSVYDGRQAMLSLHEGEYALIISDWNMPFVTGLELLSFVRSTPQIERLPFLMLTARTNIADYKELANAELTACIAKPFDSDDFIDKVRLLLGADPAAFRL